MKMIAIAIALCVSIVASGAQAHGHHTYRHHQHYASRHHRVPAAAPAVAVGFGFWPWASQVAADIIQPAQGARSHYSGRIGGRPAAWCGWEMRQLVGSDPGPSYNLAANWAAWGRAAGGPAPGVIGVMRHHVFKVIAVTGPGRVLAISGNDSHAVRTRERSTRGVIAWREG